MKFKPGVKRADISNAIDMFVTGVAGSSEVRWSFVLNFVDKLSPSTVSCHGNNFGHLG